MITKSKLCPKTYDTENMFERYEYNGDSNQKCGPVYKFEQGGKLEFGNTRSQQATVEFDAYNIQKRIANNNPQDEEIVTSGNAAYYRTKPGIEKTTFEIGNKPTDKIKNNDDIYEHFEEADNNNEQESFDNSAFTTSPEPVTSFATSVLQPYENAPHNDVSNCKESNFLAEFKKGAKDFGDNVLYNITFGTKGKEKFCWSKKSGDISGFGKFTAVLGTIIFFIFVIGIVLFMFRFCLRLNANSTTVASTGIYGKWGPMNFNPITNGNEKNMKECIPELIKCICWPSTLIVSAANAIRDRSSKTTTMQ